MTPGFHEVLANVQNDGVKIAKISFGKNHGLPHA